MDEKQTLNVSPERLAEIERLLTEGKEVNLTEEEQTSIDPNNEYPELGDLPITYDAKTAEELDPTMLAQAYAVAAQKRAAQVKSMKPASSFTKKSYNKAKQRKKDKVIKQSRKKNRKK